MADLCAQSRAHTYYCTALLHLSRNASRLSGYRSIQQVSAINATQRYAYVSCQYMPMMLHNKTAHVMLKSQVCFLCVRWWDRHNHSHELGQFFSAGLRAVTLTRCQQHNLWAIDYLSSVAWLLVPVSKKGRHKRSKWIIFVESLVLDFHYWS